MEISEPPVTLQAAPAAAGRRIYGSRYFFPILLFFIVASFYWKLTLTRQFDWMWGPDLAQQVLPWFEEEARQLQHGQLPLWDPHTWDGQPMLGQAQPGTAYPLNWILFLVPRVHGHIPRMALQWYYVVIHYMAALFMFLLCRDLGRSRAASLMAGLMFSFASYVGTTDWPQMVNGAVWAPLVFMFQLRAARGYRPLVSAALSGAFLGTAWLAGHHQVPIYISLTMGGIWLYLILRGGRIDWEVVKLAAVSIVFLFLVGSLQILPAQEYGHLAKRWAGADHELAWNEPVPYPVHQQYAMYPMSLFAILIPGMNRHSDPFIGVVAFSLALLAVAMCWKYPAVRLFAAIAVGAIIYSLGHNSVFQGFLYAVVPMVEKARVPSMATAIWSAGASVLAAFGVDHFLPGAASAWPRRLVLGTLAFGVLLYALMLGAIFVQKMHWEADDRVALTALAAVLLAGILHGWRTGGLGHKTAVTFLIMLMLLELGNVSGYAFPARTDKEQMSYLTKVVSNRDIAEFIHAQPGVFRVEADTEALVANWASYYNFDMIKALCASVTINVLNTEFHTWQTRLLFGVRYTVSEKPPLGDSREVFTGESGLKVFENPSAFPRAWSVHQIVQIPNQAKGREFISGHLDELHQKAFTLEKPFALETCPGADTVTIKKYAAEYLTLEADMNCQGLVILSDTYFPGWKATLDGQPVQIHEVDAAMRGVVAPKGKHTILMRYRPASVYLGAALTLLGWLGAIALAIRGPNGHKDAFMTAD